MLHMLRVIIVLHTTRKSSCVSFELSISISWLISGEDKDISGMSLHQQQTEYCHVILSEKNSINNMRKLE